MAVRIGKPLALVVIPIIMTFGETMLEATTRALGPWAVIGLAGVGACALGRVSIFSD
jgi:hypothetical protein